MSVELFQPPNSFYLFNDRERKEIIDYLFAKHHVADDIHTTVDYILKNIVNEIKLNELIKRCKYFNEKDVEIDDEIDKLYEKIKEEKELINILKMEVKIDSLLRKKEQKYAYIKTSEQLNFVNDIILLNVKELLTKEKREEVYLHLFLKLQHSFASL